VHVDTLTGLVRHSVAPGWQAVASIHDVRPDTLDRVAELLDLLRPHAGARVSLLLVPGLEWSASAIDRLRGWANEGYELAGHGWLHQGPPRSLYHRLHALVISRDEAEHLSRTREELIELIARGRDWFERHHLPAPELYVPPAWALGRLEPADLAAAGYRWTEVQWGFVEMGTGTFLPAPLIGFETDTRFRSVAVGVSNRLNIHWARRSGRPVRFGLHPFDLELLRAGALRERVPQPVEWLTTAGAIAILEEQR